MTDSLVDRAIQIGVESLTPIQSPKGIRTNQEALRRLSMDFALMARGVTFDEENTVFPDVPEEELAQISKGLLARVRLNLAN